MKKSDAENDVQAVESDVQLLDDGLETREDAAWRRLWERDLRRLSRAFDSLEDFHTLNGPSSDSEAVFKELTRDILLVLR